MPVKSKKRAKKQPITVEKKRMLDKTARHTPNAAAIREYCAKLVDPARYFVQVNMNEFNPNYKASLIIDKLPYEIPVNSQWAKRYRSYLSDGVLSGRGSPFLSNRGLLLRPYFIEQIAEGLVRLKSPYYRAVVFQILVQEYQRYEAFNWRELRLVFNRNPSGH